MHIVANHQTLVQYNRSERLWEARNGRVWQFPSGPAGKRQAQLYALDHDLPQVADEVKSLIAQAQAHNPHSTEAEAIARRAIKAGFLIRNGQVLPPRAFDSDSSYLNEIGRVRSSTESWPDGSAVEYAVTQPTAGEVWCECPDFREEAPTLPSGQKACKHVLAVLMAEALELDLSGDHRPAPLPSPALATAITQAEIAYHELGNLLLVMRLAQFGLSPDSIAGLEAALYPYTNCQNKLCFEFEISFDAIQRDLDDLFGLEPVPA